MFDAKNLAVRIATTLIQRMNPSFQQPARVAYPLTRLIADQDMTSH